jgi:hypothetical protein
VVSSVTWRYVRLQRFVFVGKAIVHLLPPALERLPVADVVKVTVYPVRAPAAAETPSNEIVTLLTLVGEDAPAVDAGITTATAETRIAAALPLKARLHPAMPRCPGCVGMATSSLELDAATPPTTRARGFLHETIWSVKRSSLADPAQSAQGA